MKLTVDGGLNNDPANGDIEHAVDGKPHAAGWRIRLQSDGDDLIEAVADASDGYRVSYVEDGERFNSDGPVTADVLKTLLIEYLNGDEDWNEACEFVPEKAEAAGAKARTRLMSEPPPWAIILVAGAVFRSPALFIVALPSGFAVVGVF